MHECVNDVHFSAPNPGLVLTPPATAPFGAGAPRPPPAIARSRSATTHARRARGRAPPPRPAVATPAPRTSPFRGAVVSAPRPARAVVSPTTPPTAPSSTCPPDSRRGPPRRLRPVPSDPPTRTATTLGGLPASVHPRCALRTAPPRYATRRLPPASAPSAAAASRARFPPALPGSPLGVRSRHRGSGFRALSAPRSPRPPPPRALAVAQSARPTSSPRPPPAATGRAPGSPAARRPPGCVERLTYNKG